MNEERRVELRKWSAELMGWVWSSEFSAWVLNSERDADGRLTICYPDQLPILATGDESGPFWEQIPWTPDLPTAPASQILSVIERMRELGWCLALEDFGGSPDRWRAKFGRFSLEKPNHIAVFDDNPCQAVLEAAWATGVGK